MRRKTLTGCVSRPIDDLAGAGIFDPLPVRWRSHPHTTRREVHNLRSTLLVAPLPIGAHAFAAMNDFHTAAAALNSGVITVHRDNRVPAR